MLFILIDLTLISSLPFCIDEVDIWPAGPGSGTSPGYQSIVPQRLRRLSKDTGDVCTALPTREFKEKSPVHLDSLRLSFTA